MFNVTDKVEKFTLKEITNMDEIHITKNIKVNSTGAELLVVFTLVVLVGILMERLA